SETTWCETETPGPPSRTAVSRSFRTGALGQPGTARTVSCICPAPGVLLPGQVPVEPLQRRSDHRPLMPASRHDLAADRLGGTAQRLAHHRGLLVPGPAPQKMDTADADTDFGMVAQVDQGMRPPADPLLQRVGHRLDDDRVRVPVEPGGVLTQQV